MENPKGISPRENQRGKAPMGTRTFIIAGIVIALLIGVAAVFFASGDPDGLESTALVVKGEKTLTGPAPPDVGAVDEPAREGAPYVPLLPDDTPGRGMGPVGSVIGIVLGIAITFGAIIGITRLLARPGKREGNRE
ncbi:MAG: PDGLE domain-containing protein [Methanomicrobiales archaeon]|nr:PDGLE domain-containing protein [Methanomicrobiales archaeon]